jgi:hypothetical protein
LILLKPYFCNEKGKKSFGQDIPSLLVYPISKTDAKKSNRSLGIDIYGKGSAFNLDPSILVIYLGRLRVSE